DELESPSPLDVYLVKHRKVERSDGLANSLVFSLGSRDCKWSGIAEAVDPLAHLVGESRREWSRLEVGRGIEHLAHSKLCLAGGSRREIGQIAAGRCRDPGSLADERQRSAGIVRVDLAGQAVTVEDAVGDG